MAGALIGALRVSLSAETTAFEAGMNRAQRSAKTTSSAIERSFQYTGRVIERSVIGFVTALTLGALLRAGKASLDYAGHLGELADTLGLTTKDLQTFSYAAGQVGISQDELQVGIQKLTISMGQAELGAKKQTAAFKAIGLSVDDLKGKSAGEVFRLIADKLETVSDRSKRAAVEVALFGKAGAKLDNLLSGSQGRLSELSDAAEQLGIVLSDAEIQKADQTADKIEALETVLKARFASEVAENADAILGLANALATLVGSIGEALHGWRILTAEFKAGVAAIGHLQNPFAAASNARNALANADTWASIRAGTASFIAKPKPGGTGDVGNFLAPGGGRAKKDHSAEELERKQLAALRSAYDYSRDELDAQKDILDAKKDLSQDYVEQTSLSIDILNLERQQYKADLDNQVAENKITKGKDGIVQAQADHLLALYDQADHDKRAKILNDEQEQRLRDVAMLEDHDLERRQDLLSKQADLATTQSERRQIELDLLKLAYEEKRQALQRIIDNSKDQAAIEDARRDLLDLNKNYAADRQGVLNQTRGPLEEWAATVPKTAAEINQALQSIEAQGLDSLSDAIADVIDGTKSLKDAFGDVAKSIIADIIRMTVRVLIFRALSSVFGGLFGGSGGGQLPVDIGGGGSLFQSVPGFANGGSFTVGGRPGIDRNMLSLNGLPIANVSMGERVSVGNDNGGGPQRVIVELRDDMLDAKIASGSQVQIIRSAPAMRSMAIQGVRDRSRRG